MALFGKSWKFYSNLERILIVTATVSTIVVISLSIKLMSHTECEGNYCGTSECIVEAAKIVQQINPAINPCEDFYEFSCGTYLRRSHDENKVESPLNLLYSQMEQEIHDLCREPIQINDHYMVRSEKKLFKACMNRREKSQDHTRTIKEVLKELGGWPVIEGPNWDESKFDWVETTYKLREIGYPFGIFVDLLVPVDPRNNSNYILEVFLPTLSADKTTNETMITDARRYGANIQVAIKEVNDMHEFAMKLKSNHYIRNDTKNIFTVAEFQEANGYINWLEFINRICAPTAKITAHDYVLFPELDILQARIELIKNTPPRTIANYMLWKMVEQIVPYLRVKHEAVEERARSCFRIIEERYIPNPMYIIYARKYLPISKMKQIQELVFNIRNEVINVVDEIKWLQEEKRSIKDRIKTMTVVIGQVGDYFNDKILDDLNVDMKNVTDDNFLNLLSQATRNHASQMYSMIYKSKYESVLNYHRDWLVTPHLISYSMQTNILRISTILLQNTVFAENRPNYFNYGILGTTLSNYISSIIINDESIMETKHPFTNFSSCISSDMESLGVSKNEILVKAIPTYITGSIAVYRSWMKFSGKDQKLIGLDYSPNKLFWISTVACYPGTPYDRISMYYHTMYNDVIKTYMRNVPEFARDFECPVDSPMNPSRRCYLV